MAPIFQLVNRAQRDYGSLWNGVYGVATIKLFLDSVSANLPCCPPKIIMVPYVRTYVPTYLRPRATVVGSHAPASTLRSWHYKCLSCMGQPAKLGLCARFKQERNRKVSYSIFSECVGVLLVLALDGGELMGRWHHSEKEPTNMVQIRTYSKLGLA